MKRGMLATMLLLLTIMAALSGCGGGNDNRTVVTSITSDPAVDGDIELTPPNIFTITNVTQVTPPSVLVSNDPISETRGFLDFPLAAVPVHAFIESAILQFFLNTSQTVGSTLFIRVELVELLSNLQPQQLSSGDFSQPALRTATFTRQVSLIPSTGRITLDVTDLMDEAQFLQLANLQLRISLDSTGSMEINDPPSTTAGAPTLVVAFH